MLRLSSRIKIFGTETIEFPYTYKGEVESSWKNLTDKAKLEIPKTLQYKGRPIVNGDKSIMAVGDRVEIQFGYFGDIVYNRELVFAGYITHIKPKRPMEIDLEDEMWLLKQKTIPKLSLPKAKEVLTLTSLMKAIGDGDGKNITVQHKGKSVVIPYVLTLERNLGTLRITNATVAQVLENLRKEHFIQSFFRNGTLYIGLAYVPALQNPKKLVFDYSQNLIDGDGLEYRKAEDVKIKVTVTSAIAKKKDIKKGYGDADGQAINIKLNGATASQMDDIGNQMVKEHQYTGLYGKFVALGYPRVNHGDVASIVNKKIPEYNGDYIIRSVKLEFGDGIRQTVEPDFKVTR